MKFLVTLFVLNTLIISAHAESTYSVDKAQLVFAAVAKNQETSEYLRLAQDIPNHSELNVDPKTFLSVVMTGASEVKTLVEQKHVRERIGRFARANQLQPQMVGYNFLFSAQKSFINVLVLLELQNQLFVRNDLEIFGAQTVKNLNLAINEAIQIQYRNAEAASGRIVYGDTKQKVKDNFLAIALDFKNPPTRSETWITESGLLGNYVPPMNPHILLNKIANESLRRISSKLGAITSCTPMFLT